jgi:phosphatidylglycerol lysyltransferase
MAFTAYFFLKPFVYQPVHNAEEYDKARELVRRYGRSALDYFKTYFDKYIFFSEQADAFVACRVAHGYAVVLEDPVCAGPEALPGIIKEFDAFCLRNGLRSVYYRVGQESLAVYESLGKKKLLIGQEAVVDLTAFTLPPMGI